MPGLAIDTNQANAKPKRSTGRPNRNNNAAAATYSAVKKEDTDDDASYRSRPQLPTPLTLKRNLTELMKMMDENVIDVDPEYQREVVWTADRMTGLIDSLMENFYVPPIILNKKPRQDQDEGAPQETFVCVDGKQRLSSVLAFIKGIIPCHDYRGEKWWFCERANTKRKQVFSEHQQGQFLRKDFVSFEYNNLSPEQEEDLFARVQMGVQLNLAEKMRASSGPWQELARLFVIDFPSVHDLLKDKARSKDFQLTLSCFSQIVECMHPTAANGVPILKTNHTHLPKLLANKGAVDDALKSHLASVWNTFKDLIDADPNTFTNGNKYLQGVQTFAPVEMVAVTVLISTHSETRNNRLLLGDIQAMRIAARENFVDLRLNATVWKWFWEYIDELEAIRGAIDGSTVDRTTKQRKGGKEKSHTLHAASGSTVAAINAAAAAPKRGRFTARTKHPSAAVAEEVPVVVKQEPVTAQMPGPPPLKRKRTEEAWLARTHSGHEPQWSPFPEMAAPAAELQERGLAQDGHLPPMPTHASTQSSTSAAQRPPQRSAQASVAPQVTAPLLRSPSNSVYAVQHPAYPSTPSEARQQRISTLESFQSARQSIPLPSTSGSMTHHGQLMGEERRTPAAPILQSTHTPLPDRNNRNDTSTIPGSLASGIPAPSSTLAPPRPESKHVIGMPRPRLTQKVPAETIDLTGDTEQERQDLLSSFKARPVSSVPQSKPAVEPAARKRLSTVTDTTNLPQGLPQRGGNPYARFKHE